MKLRIKGNSLRLRISQTELAQLLRDGTIEETIHFGMAAEATLTYGLKHAAADRDIGLEYVAQRVTVVLSTAAATRWTEGDDVGIYGSCATGDGALELMLEKDFACLDRDDPANKDAFPNPKAGAVC